MERGSENQQSSRGSSVTKELSIGPSNWSDEELLIQLQTFAEVKLSGESNIESVHVENKRLLDRPQSILLEVFMRFNFFD